MSKHQYKFPYVFIVGNEKGGAGKTTCSMHLIIGLLDYGFRVSSIDTDHYQHSLTRYIQKRKLYNERNQDHQVKVPIHFLVKGSTKSTIIEQEKEEQSNFENALKEAKDSTDIVVVDTPGSHCFLSRIAHSYADTVITPLNDSFLDVDLLARIDHDSFKILQPSVYSEMIWKQKLLRAQRDHQNIEWVIMRNRLSNVDAVNKRNVGKVIEDLSKRIGFRVASGFSERVIFRELFLKGLTLFDLIKANHGKTLTLSHIAARQELREFLTFLNIDKLNKTRQYL